MPKNQAHLEARKRIRELEKEIAESRKAIDAVKREKLFSEKVLDSLPGIFYLYSEEGDLIQWNKNHETLTGYSAEELPRRSMLEWFSGKDQQRVQEAVRDLFKDGNRRDVEADLIIKSGQRIPYYFTGVRMTLNGRKYLLGVGIDLTEQKKTEDALRRSEEKYRAIFENAVEGIYQTTPQGEVVSANPAMADILGYDTPEELMAAVRDVSKDLYHSQSARKNFLSLLRQGKTVSGFEVEFLRKNGSRIWVSLHARPIADNKGKLLLIEGIFFDITSQKREADALREREEYLRKENIRLRSNIKDRYRFGDIVGKSTAMQDVYEMILKAAATDTNVIIYGESGTGKELVARAIYQFSDRKKKRFVPVNCGAIPENLLESEFFGYKKGAFTGAAANKEGYLDLADGGVLFLDELGEIEPNLQVKLLRVLEGGGYTPVGGLEVKKPNLRILAATNRNLQDYVARGIMREDFYYRIHIIPIYLPPLRERKEDIPLLIEHFLKNAGSGNEPLSVTGEMMEAMIRHDWPGNVRELQNVLHRFRTLNRFDLVKCIPSVAAGKRPERAPEEIRGIRSETFSEAMDRVERGLLLSALESNRWHREAAAKSIGLAPRTFYRKIKYHGLIRQN
jgi:PAS domain S-box-containing protein